ncbi:MAG: nitroreductase family deazaflavin-dependent oxidoreductase [Deltaproteobacteria bacterium]|nr:nitroreductase family deazaflavin-dependent oxidoreductase [Deltaproteobacteria bacterium]
MNLVFTVVEGRVYVNAGASETRWVKNIQADPRVRLRIEGRIYELRADRVTDAAEIAAFGEAWTSQSFFRRDPRKPDEVWIYRLDPR